MERHYLLDRKSQIPSALISSHFLLYGVWSHNAHIIMEDVSHLTMGFLQTCGYMSEQMQSHVKIDVKKFLGAFSIETDGGYIHPPSWIPGSESVAVVPSVPIVKNHLGLKTLHVRCLCISAH